MDKLFDLKNKVAIVTGASRGLGRSIAVGLAKAGADVVVSDILEASETVKEVEAQGRKALEIRTDVSKEDEVRVLVERAKKTFNKIDILANNAGIFKMSPAEETRTEDWDKTININLKGQFLCAREVSRHMIAQKSGKIINVASIAGIMAFPDSIAYNASKAGIILLTKTLAAEWGRHNIQVNAICPGFFETEMTREFTKDKVFMEAISKDIPLGRGGAPDELIGTVVYLASKASDYMTGHALVIDGGWTVKL